jgi:hypothetical protein
MQMTPGDPIAVYVVRLRTALAGLSVAEREDIVEEIRTHVRDRVAESGLTVPETLSRLGPPEELARDYYKGALVRRARSSFSPWIILKASFRWAMTGVHGLSVFLIAIIGYSLGTGLVLCGLLKPLFPEQTGLWIGPETFQLGFRPEGNPEVHELLGPWFTQISIALGVLSFIVTTLVMRKLLPKLKRWKASASAATASALHRGDAPAARAGG